MTFASTPLENKEAPTDIQSKFRSVAAIENGTVLDHITSGKAGILLKLLKINNLNKLATIGINLPSSRINKKDIIKIADWIISPLESEQIAIFSPQTTVSIIQNYRVIKKFQVTLPEKVSNLILCLNPNCISNHEISSHLFHIKHYRNEIQFQCNYCERCYFQNEIIQFTLQDTE